MAVDTERRRRRNGKAEGRSSQKRGTGSPAATRDGRRREGSERKSINDEVVVGEGGEFGSLDRLQVSLPRPRRYAVVQSDDEKLLTGRLVTARAFLFRRSGRNDEIHPGTAGTKGRTRVTASPRGRAFHRKTLRILPTCHDNITITITITMSQSLREGMQESESNLLAGKEVTYQGRHPSIIAAISP